MQRLPKIDVVLAPGIICWVSASNAVIKPAKVSSDRSLGIGDTHAIDGKSRDPDPGSDIMIRKNWYSVRWKRCVTVVGEAPEYDRI